MGMCNHFLAPAFFADKQSYLMTSSLPFVHVLALVLSLGRLFEALCLRASPVDFGTADDHYAQQLYHGASHTSCNASSMYHYD
jgi:hypothetical protein